ncbi:adenylyltransferase/cytidyltransferase family protein [Candidatus Peregrinibacteria bacterium]|nr:adenylyltransferase/cytidyltransferase family protein [Candidatus Peregrinibacteria bacterium]
MFFGNKKNNKGKTVMAFGTFDILHAGHENFFKQAGELGNQILVIVSRDETVKSVKSESAQNSEKIRLKNLRKTGWADKVILGNHGDKHKVITKYKPDIIALGYDQFVFTQTIEKTLIDANINAKVIRLMPFEPQVFKSSLIKTKQRINEAEIKESQNQYQQISN